MNRDQSQIEESMSVGEWAEMGDGGGKRESMDEKECL